MNKKSIYTTVCSLCAVACAFTVVSVNTSKTNKERKEALKSNEEIIEEPSLPTVPKNSLVKKEEPVQNITEPVPKPVETEPENESEIELLSPVSNGKIGKTFSDTALVFSETYNDYRTHNGIDLEAKKDSPVSAVFKGTIIKNEFDYQDGYTVEIEHENGLVSVYKNLSNDKTVRVGQVVETGETIGTIGNTGISESNEESHLHFELREDNVEIDPQLYISF